LLLIEPRRILARPLKRGLEEEGFEVVVASDGAEGDREATTGDYEAIILDPDLPDEDGLALMRRWRDDGLTTPVLVLSARAGPAERGRAFGLGADDYLALPFALDDLLDRVRDLAGRGAPLRLAVAYSS
jgi:DNA-binding response OmpR family regulator